MKTFKTTRWEKQDIIAFAAFALLIAAFAFGGASRLHDLRVAITELVALPLLVLALLALFKRTDLHAHRFSLSILGAFAALPLLQLIPLPAGVWISLPGRDQPALALEIARLTPGWAPLSLTADNTWRAFLALTPPLAMFLAVLGMRSDSNLRLVHLVLVGVLLSIVMGAFQLAFGDRFHLWPTTNAGNITGFFANRNHFATLCLVGMPFAAVLGGAALRRNERDARLQVWLAALYIGLTAVALGIIRSRAGVILFGPVLGLSLLAAWAAAGRGRPRPLFLGLVAGAGLAIAAVGVFAAGPILARFDANGSPEGRFENWPIVADAAATYLPFGSGIGSFDAVYRSVEPLDRLDPTYFNQAHNDYLETWLETGWFGAAISIAFFIWFARRIWTAWRAMASTQRDLQRAATIAIGAILIHSAADYPLRTVTIATLFAMCCALVELAVRSDSELKSPRPRSRSRSR